MIDFQTIKWRNFLSTGDQFTEVSLNQYPSTLILGENGSGKSTFLDALTFVLFGKPFRNINKPQLLNSLNQRELEVAVEFQIGKNQYKVVRGMKPNIFEIYQNGKMLDQDSKIKDYQEYLENTILHLNYKSFCQVVVLGSAGYVPFMQLKASDRRFIIEDLLDIQIFSAMNQVLKQKLSELKDESLRTENAVDISKEKISLRKKYLEELKINAKTQVQANKKKIKENQKSRVEYEEELTSLQKEIDELIGQISNEDKIRNRIRKLESLEDQLNATKIKLEKEMGFFDKNEICPTCKQPIDEKFKLETIKSKSEQIIEISDALQKLNEDLTNNQNKLNTIITVLGNIQAKQRLLNKVNSSIHAIDQYIQKLQEEIEELLNKKESNEDDKIQLNELQKELEVFLEKRDKIIEDKHYYDIIALMLKDNGIKTKIIRQYLPIINNLVNKYLTALDFFVNFTLDEFFNESIKSRGRDEFSYASFSEGEKLRIDLALLFTWRDVAKMKNSASTNLLILDEIFDSSLDSAGTEEFLKLINNLQQGTNIFIISHRADHLIDKFSNSLVFKKVKNFSVLLDDRN